MKTAIITFGRFQGFHKGHRRLFEEMKKYKSFCSNADMMIYISKTHNKNSPMLYDTKLRNFKNIFPQYINDVHDHSNSLVKILQELDKEYSRVYFFCGSDHKDNFQSFFDRYNGVEFSFGIIRAVTVERTSKKESGTYIRSIVDKLSFYWYVPGSIKAIHQYKKDLKEALDYFSSIQTKKR